MRYLSVEDVLAIHARLISSSGGTDGIRDRGGLESAVAQPLQTFGGVDLYPTILEKAACLCFALVQNHPFLDGNKRIGHASMEVVLVLNGLEIDASVDDQEHMIMRIAEGKSSREELTQWLRSRIAPAGSS